MKFRDFSEKFEEVMKKMATFEGKKKKNLDFLIFFLKFLEKFRVGSGKVSIYMRNIYSCIKIVQLAVFSKQLQPLYKNVKWKGFF